MELGKKLGRAHSDLSTKRLQIGNIVEGKELPPTTRLPALGYLPSARVCYEVTLPALPAGARICSLYLIEDKLVIYHSSMLGEGLYTLSMKDGVPYFGAFVYTGALTDETRIAHLDACAAASDLVPFIDGTETHHAWSVLRSADVGSLTPPSKLRDDFGGCDALKLGSPALVTIEEPVFLWR